MNDKFRLNRKQVITGTILLILIGSVRYCVRKKPTDLDDPILHSYKPPQEYLDLFAKSSQSLLTPDETDYFKKEYPISGFYFDEKKYVIQIYKIGKIGTSSLKDIINIDNELSILPSGGLPYRNYSEHSFLVDYRPSQRIIKTIIFNLHRDSLKLVANNDTTISVYANFKDFSLQYNKKDTLMMFGKPGDDHDDYSSSSLPMIITFLKRNNSIYVLIMSINKQIIGLKPELMYDLINGTYK